MIDHTDLKITCPDADVGGQHVGISTRVRVEHMPTGIAAECEERSQHRSRNTCISMIEWGLLEAGG